MRLQMRLSRACVLALREYKELKFEDKDARVTQGYLVKMAYKSIEEDLGKIDWKAINTTEIENVTNSTDTDVKDSQTALNIDSAVLEEIEKMQKDFMRVFDTKKMFKPFVIKLIMFAAILKENDMLIGD